MSIKCILVPVDGSASAHHAARFAVQLSAGLGAPLTFIYVMELTSWNEMGLQALTRDQFTATKERLAEEVFEPLRDLLKEAATTATWKVSVGDPSVEIIQAARIENADLIVIGNRGRGQLQGLLLGSVSEKVMRHALCPVTIVR